jgi:hypothetical protein
MAGENGWNQTAGFGSALRDAGNDKMQVVQAAIMPLASCGGIVAQSPA